MRRFRRQLLWGFTCLAAAHLLQLTIPRYLKTGVDELAQGAATGQRLAFLGGCILLTAAGTGILRYSWRVLLIGFSRHLETELRDRLTAHVLRMDQAFFDRRSPGDIMAHASNDLGAVQMAFGMGLAAAADAAVMSVAAVLFMAHISPSLTLTAALPLPVLAVVSWLLSRELHRRFDRVQAQFGLLTEFARNTLVSIRMIKSCTREEQQLREFDRLGQDYAALNIRTAFIQGLLLPAAMLTGSVAALLVLRSGGGMVISGTISLGDFVAFISYFAMLSPPLAAVGWAVGMIRRGLTSLARTARLLAEASVLTASLRRDAACPAQILQSCPRISLRQLSFFYPGSVSPTLVGINLEVSPGLLGITGRTGSGKSTLCRILLRQYPTADGSYFFAGHDVNCLDPALVREHISYAGRESPLFSGTAAENISLARPDATIEEIMEAAHLAAVHEEIMAMPEGYRTRLGEKGLRLSGGQRQRIAIARALLADRPVLVIDDALSALDAETGAEVFAAVRARQRGRSLILVSHHLPLLACADHVLILEQGRIADQGSHAELLARSAYSQSGIK